MNDSQRVAIGLTEYQSMGDWRLLFLDRDRIKTVTPEDVARVAKLYLKSSNRTIGQFIPTDHPDRSEIPAPADVSAMVKDYKGQAALAQGEAFDPSPANIDARTVRVTLPNGMKLALLSKKTRGATVRATLTLHYGDEKSLFGKESAAQMAGQMLMRGTEKHNRQQLQDELDKLKAQMNVSASMNAGATVSISTVRDGFAGALRLAAEVSREPAFPESDFEQLRQSMTGRIESQRGEPQALAINAMNRHLNEYPPGDPRAIATLDESIDGLKKLTLAEVKKFHADFYGASHAELAVIGDFDVAEVQKLIADLFGDWKSPAPYTRLSRTWKKLDAVNRTIETPDKANAFFAAGTTIGMNEADPDYPAMLLANEILGGGIQSRLWTRIRETDGLSYSVQSVFYAGATEKFAQFLAVAVSNPKNSPKVESAFKEEIAKAVNSGFTSEEIATVKKAYLEEAALSRSEDASLARMLTRNEQNGWTMAHDAAIEAKIAKLTAEDVNAALKRRLDPASLSDFKAGDFKKAGVNQ
jgi:zinc protease